MTGRNRNVALRGPPAVSVENDRDRLRDLRQRRLGDRAKT